MGQYFVTETHIALYYYASTLIKDGRTALVLDIGCGAGHGGHILGRRCPVVAMDRDGDPLRYARNCFGSSGLQCVRADAQYLPFKAESFDMLVVQHVVEHLPDPALFLTEAKRVLKRYGILFCSTPNVEVASGRAIRPRNPAHTKEYTPGELKAFLRTCFPQVSIESVFPQGRADRKIYRWGTAVLWWVGNRHPRWLPGFLRLVQTVTRFGYRRYRWQQADKVRKLTEAELATILARYPTFPPGGEVPQQLIGIAVKGDEKAA